MLVVLSPLTLHTSIGMVYEWSRQCARQCNTRSTSPLRYVVCPLPLVANVAVWITPYHRWMTWWHCITPLHGVLNTHIQPTHFLRAWICWCAWDLIISILVFSYLSIRMHTTVWRLQCYARLHHILILLSSHSVCTYVHPCLAPAPLLLCVCYHIPIHILCMCTCVLYSTRSVPPYMVLCHLLHIYMCAPKYAYTY